MANETHLIKTFSCPHCGGITTITQLAAEPLVTSGKIPEGTSLSAQKIVLPLLPLEKITGLTAMVLLIERDYCADCGTEYTIRVSTIEAPIQMGRQPPPGSGPFGGFNFKQPPPGMGRG